MSMLIPIRLGRRFRYRLRGRSRCALLGAIGDDSGSSLGDGVGAGPGPLLGRLRLPVSSHRQLHLSKTSLQSSAIMHELYRKKKVRRSACLRQATCPCSTRKINASTIGQRQRQRQQPNDDPPAQHNDRKDKSHLFCPSAEGEAADFLAESSAFPLLLLLLLFKLCFEPDALTPLTASVPLMVAADML